MPDPRPVKVDQHWIFSESMPRDSRLMCSFGRRLPSVVRAVGRISEPPGVHSNIITDQVFEDGIPKVIRKIAHSNHVILREFLRIRMFRYELQIVLDSLKGSGTGSTGAFVNGKRR